MTKNKKHFLIAVIACALASSSVGLNINLNGLYIQPVSQAIGVSTGAFSLHSTFISIGIAMGSISVPVFLKKMDYRLLVLIASVVAAVMTLLMSFSTQVWMFSILGFTRGFASAFFGFVGLQFLINNWFISKHGLVTSLVFSFGGVAGAILSPIVSSLMESRGWQAGYWIQAVLYLVFAFPALLIPYKASPQEEGLEPYQDGEQIKTVQEGDFKSAVKPFSYKTPTFVLVILMSIFATALTGMVQHLPGVATDFAFTARTGAMMISAAMIANILFKLLVGVLNDSKGAVFANMVMLVAVAAGFVLMLFGANQVLMLSGSFLFGAIYGLTAVGVALLIKHLYPIEHFGRVFPIVSFTQNIGAAFAISIYGFSYDLSGGYTAALIGSIAVTVLIAVLMLMANKSIK